MNVCVHVHVHVCCHCSQWLKACLLSDTISHPTPRTQDLVWGVFLSQQGMGMKGW